MPGNDFQLTFHTPYAPLFEGGKARIGFLMGTRRTSSRRTSRRPIAPSSWVSRCRPEPPGSPAIEFMPSKKTKVEVDGQKKPVALKQWLKGDQLAEINAAVRQIMGLSMASRFELADGQEVSLGAAPNP